MDTCCEKGRTIDVDCIYADGKFTLECLPGSLPTRCTLRFKAPVDFSHGDMFVVKGRAMPAKTPAMDDAPSGFFKTGAIVLCELDLDGGTVFFCHSGPGGVSGGALPNLSYTEQYAGYNDEDGNKVYVKVIDFGELPAGSIKTVPHGIANLKEVIHDMYRWKGTDAPFLVGSHAYRDCYLWYCTSTDVVFRTLNGENMTGRYGKAVLFYTCTDR